MGLRGEVCSQQVSHSSQLTFKELSTQFDLNQPWPVPSRPLVNPPEEKLPGSSWPPRLPGSPPPLQEEWRSPTDTGQEQSLFVRSEDTRSPLSCSSGSCPSSVWWEKLLRTSRLISGSSLLPLELSRRPVRLTSSVCLRTPTCALSTPSVSLLCQRISSLLAVSAESVPKFSRLSSLFLCLTKYYLFVCGVFTPPAPCKSTKSYSGIVSGLSTSDGAPRYSLAVFFNSATNLQILSSIIF